MSGPPEEAGPPEHVEIPDAVPERIRRRLLSGRSVQTAGQTGPGGI